MGEQLPRLEMRIDSLPCLPAPELAEGYRLRPYREGDAADWCRLVKGCIGGECREEDSASTIAGARAFAPEDLLFVAREGAAVGTAWALRKASLPPETGYGRMVAVQPDHRGQRLGRTLMVGVLCRFHEVGCRSAQLHTDDFRLPALHLYLALGFRPVLTHPSHPDRWRQVSTQLGILLELPG